MVWINEYIQASYSNHSKMGFIGNVGRFLNVYYYFGLSPYRVDMNTNKLNLCHSSKCVHAIISVLVASTLIANVDLMGKWMKIRKMEQLLITVSASFDILRSVIVLLQSFLLHEQIKEILLNFRRIETIFASHLNYVIRYDAFNKKHLWKCVTIIVPYILHISVYFVRHITLKDWLTVSIGFPAGFLKLFQVLTFLYIILYIDALGFFLAQLNCVIERDTIPNELRRTSKPEETQFVLGKLLSFKTIHFQLWEIGQIHNSVFGWCTIALLLHTSIELMYSSFWFWDEVKRQTGLLKMCLPIVSFLDISTSFLAFSSSCHSMLREVLPNA